MLRVAFFVSTVCVNLLVLLSLPDVATSAKILAVAFFSLKSNKITYDSLLRELGARGHEVTVLTPVVSTKQYKNVREILTIDPAVLESMPNPFQLKEEGKDFHFNTFAIAEIVSKYCELAYDQPHVKALLKEKFDLVMMPVLFNECTAGFVHKLNTSLILTSPFTATGWLTHYTGGSSPTSFVPSIYTGFTHRMTLWQRLVNFLTDQAKTLPHVYYFNPIMEAIYRDKLNDQSLPSASEILKNASLVLSNGHFTLGSPKPYLPDIIEVAGMHCKQAEKLPAHLEDFIQGAGDHGFVYFSMGSVIQGNELPEAHRQIFLKAFSKLKQRVLWKWETETMADLPPNVKLSKWLPQQDILGHLKLRVFITHGGYGSTTEAAYHGTPMIGLPMFADQDLNMQLAKEKNFAIPLDFMTLTEEQLSRALNDVINNQTFKENANAVSRIFRDQPETALDRAVFWTEYVIRHRGAVHLRSAARDLNFVQYYSLDVISILLLTAFATVYLICALFKLAIRALRGINSNSSLIPNKKQN